jgi:hypothetical protein
MKKLSIIAFAALLVVAFTAPTYAVEHIFGGYWRTRFYSQGNFSTLDDDGNRFPVVDDTGAPVLDDQGRPTFASRNRDFSQVDTRTRLYYTAKFSDNFKFVNKFEFDAVWGDLDTYGRVGADTRSVEVKNSYIDFNLGAHRFEVGVQGFLLAKGFLFDDDAAGMKLIFNAGEGIYLPLIWVRFYEGGQGEFFSNFTGSWSDFNDGDTDALIFYPSIYFSENMRLYPHIAWLYSNQIQLYPGAVGLLPPEIQQVDVEASAWSVGIEWDHTMGAFNYGLTGIYQFGGLSTEVAGNSVDIDLQGYLFSATAGFDFGAFDVHGEFTYASGDDDRSDEEYKAFLPLPGASYYWAEIMGLGMFDYAAPAGTPGNKIENVWFFNIGSGFKPMDKLKLKADLYYASLVEKTVGGDEDLGWEIDLVATYALLDGLNLDLVGAYLFAGDALPGDEDPWELGARLSLSF